jgi:arylsulfatase A-like enzyme
VKRVWLVLVAVLIAASVVGLIRPSPAAAPRRNVVLFVADGLRPGSVNPTDAPTLWRLRQEGVNFVNSHAVFPTVTTANASALTTGHYLGDTGDFSNTLFLGYPAFDRGAFGSAPGTYTPFIENDQVLADMNDHFRGNYLGEETLLGAARAAGYQTAVIGKVGPSAVLDVTQVQVKDGKFTPLSSVVIDDATGHSGLPLPPPIAEAMKAAGVGLTAPPRGQPPGTNSTSGSLKANVEQQQWMIDAVTRAVLPAFKAVGKPFLLVFWSRDPDGTQHNQGDSLNKTVPGINGPTSRLAVQNADANLRQILECFSADADLAANTDVFVTADHGFATISRRDIDRTGRATASYAARFVYKDATGRQEVNTGFLPPGFLAVDLAHALTLPLYDPDLIVTTGDGRVFARVDATLPRATETVRQHPSMANGLIGGTGRVMPSTDARVVVAANGGSDLIYVPNHDPARVRAIVAFLAAQDYVGGIFVDDKYGDLPGALPFSLLNLKGTTSLPVPAIIVSFRSFATDPSNPLGTAVQIADTALQHGQGNHGALTRDNTFNNMAAIGPDFKKRYVDRAPVGNVDVAPTLARILKLTLEPEGPLMGRVIEEAIVGGPASVPYAPARVRSRPAASGARTVLRYQTVGERRYLDQACFAACR